MGNDTPLGALVEGIPEELEIELGLRGPQDTREVHRDEGEASEANVAHFETPHRACTGFSRDFFLETL